MITTIDKTRFRNASLALEAHAEARGEEYKACRGALVAILVDLQHFAAASALSFNNALTIAREYCRTDGEDA